MTDRPTPEIASLDRPRYAEGVANLFTTGGMNLGSIRVGCWDRSCGGQEPGLRGTWLGHALERPSPAEIVGQVARRDAVEAAHPALQPTVVGVHVLDVEGAIADADAGREVD